MDLQKNADRFSGSEYTQLYDRYRPTPPQEILQQCLNYADQSKADLVVDLGCGTGLSTDVWGDFATQVVGVDPSQSMIAIAKGRHTADNIQYRTGFAHAIPVADHTADIVSCSQSFHWMEPSSTLQDISRILRKRGVLVIYDVAWPPSVNMAFEKAFWDLFQQVGSIIKQLDETLAYKWNKDQHLHNVRQSGLFSHTKVAYYHKTKPLDKAEFVGIALSQGELEALIKKGFSEEEIGITQFKETINAIENIPFATLTYHYRVFFAIAA